MPILFLSHSGSDTEAARQLKQRIEASPAAKEAGLEVWFDKDNLQAGKPWRNQLETAIAQVDAFAVLVGSKGVVNWVEAEVDLALSRATTSPEFLFIPIIAKESAGSAALPAFARRYQGVFDPLSDSNELAKLVKAATGGDWDREPILTDEPFVGLRSMDEAWANRFFGREAEIHDLVEKFKKHRLVAIVADSGAGKSSLAKAGFVPAFRGGAVADESHEAPDDRVWHVVVMRPGNDPVQGLKDGITDTAKLLGLGGTEQSGLRGRVDISDFGESAYALRCDLDRKTTETLLIVDQFEELLIQTPEEKRAPFVELLCALVDGCYSFRILLTLRADYFNFDDSLATLRSRLWANHQDAVFRLRRMSDSALAETARAPLALVGFKDRPEVDALIQAIQRDVSDREGDLALVQMALHSVWRRHATRSMSLLEAYEEVQGVPGALAHEAEKVRTKLSEAQQALLFPILARLIRRGEIVGATRRIAQRDEFDAEKQVLIRHLTTEEGGRLLLASDDSVEIGHEALIRQWSWLRTEWPKFAPDTAELARLMDKAKAWAKAAVKDHPKYLATGADLETFSALAERREDWLSTKEREFVDASDKARKDEDKRRSKEAARLRWTSVASGIFLTAAAIFLSISLINFGFGGGISNIIIMWRYLFHPESTPAYTNIVDHFKYGSVGSEVTGLPYWVWKALPELYPDKLPSGDLSTFGLLYETDASGKKLDLPIGLSRRTLQGIERVWFNCALCHTGTVQNTAGGARQIVVGMPSNNLDFYGLVAFLVGLADDPKLNSDTLVPAMKKVGAPFDDTDELVWSKMVMIVRESLIVQRAVLTQLLEHQPSWGPGRGDTFNSFKMVQFHQRFTDLSEAEKIGVSDFPSIFNQRPRGDQNMELHWDGNNPSLQERNLSAALGAGATEYSGDHASIDRVAYWLLDLHPPANSYKPDPAKVVAGKEIYVAECASCHGRQEPEGYVFDGEYLGKVTANSELGVDHSRLDSYTEKLRDYQLTLFGDVDGGKYRFRYFRKTDGYANLPLDGLWLRAPYLHNGSVPTLADLLLPPEQRPKAFIRGFDLLDPQHGGFVAPTCAPGKKLEKGFCFDTSVRGNGNGGHLYGVNLPAKDKADLLAYLLTF